MIADATTPGPGWAWIVGLVVFVAALVVLALDRVRLRRRCAAGERAEALLRTDLADARRDVDALRDCLRDRAPSAAGGASRDAAPGDPTASVG